MKEKIKAYFEKNAKKENLLIVALLGILLMVIALPVDGPDDGKKEGTGGITQEGDAHDALAVPGGGYEMSYEEEMEQRLKTLLECMYGVGKVEVMITLAATDERIVLKDYDISEEEDSVRSSETTIFYTDDTGRESPYCTRIITPEVEGVVVVAEGGDDPRRIIEITEVIQSLFDVPIHKIRVVRMKSE